MKKVTIGKYTLESLTTGMYVEPYVLYREYVQNSADSIDKAIEDEIVVKKDAQIDIYISKDKGTIKVIDNGTGIKSEKAYGILADIGNSKKKSNNNKGFRGIGRLSGLGYCDRLIFETSAVGEATKAVVTFDSNILQELLSPGKYEELTLEDVILRASSVEIKTEEKDKHYLKVKMENVNEKLNLLDFQKLLTYLQETLPVPYNEEGFEFGPKINEALVKLNQNIEEYNVFLHSDDSSTQILKPYTSKIRVDIKKKLLDEITDVEMHIIVNDLKDDKPVALVWYGKCALKGSIAEDSIKGLRIRKSGLLIGNRTLANAFFKEDRFNGWVIGEVICLDPELIPNARRDDFEKNDDYLYLVKELKKIGEKISNDIRKASSNRNDKTVNREKGSSQEKNNSSVFREIDILISRIRDRENMIENLQGVLNKNGFDTKSIEKIILELK